MSFFYSQLFARLPYPTESLTGKTVIVTGSNVGLGKEAARHLTRMGASTVILAVRSLEKGEEAKLDIEKSTGTNDVVQVWHLDLASYESVKDFAAKSIKELSRIDILLENAGIATRTYRKAEEDESTITVNVVSTFLLAFLLLPKLKDTAKKFNTRPTLTIVSSEVHAFPKFPEQNAPEGEILKTLSGEETVNMAERYPVSKLLEVLSVREIVSKTDAKGYPVTLNVVNPGLCHSELAREAGWGLWLMKLLLARSTEYGSRTLVHAATQGAETHGEYMSDCAIGQPSEFVRSPEGEKSQKRVWDELSRKLEKIQPGVTSNL